MDNFIDYIYINEILPKKIKIKDENIFKKYSIIFNIKNTFKRF